MQMQHKRDRNDNEPTPNCTHEVLDLGRLLKFMADTALTHDIYYSPDGLKQEYVVRFEIYPDPTLDHGALHVGDSSSAEHKYIFIPPPQFSLLMHMVDVVRQDHCDNKYISFNPNDDDPEDNYSIISCVVEEQLCHMYPKDQRIDWELRFSRFSISPQCYAGPNACGAARKYRKSLRWEGDEEFCPEQGCKECGCVTPRASEEHCPKHCPKSGFPPEPKEKKTKVSE